MVVGWRQEVAHPSWRPGMGIGITGVNEAGTMLEDWGTGALRGSIVISNSTVHDTWGSGLFVTSKGSNAAGLLVSEVRFENVQRQPAGANCPAPVSKSCPPPPGSYAAPIEIGGNSHSCFETGGIRFVSCSVVDSYDRPFVTMDNHAGQCAKTKSGEWGLVNISGEFKITNEFGCRYSKSTNESGIALTVDCVKDSRFPGLKSDDYDRKKPLLPRILVPCPSMNDSNGTTWFSQSWLSCAPCNTGHKALCPGVSYLNRLGWNRWMNENVA